MSAMGSGSFLIGIPKQELGNEDRGVEAGDLGRVEDADPRLLAKTSLLLFC